MTKSLDEINAIIEREKQEKAKRIMEATTSGELIRAQIECTGDFVELLVNFAKQWTENGSLESIIRNRHMNEFRGSVCPENQALVDAAVVDFINFVASQYCMDCGLYTRDLRNMSYIKKPCCFNCKYVPPWVGTDLTYCYGDGMNSFPHVCNLNKCLVCAGECCNQFTMRDSK